MRNIILAGPSRAGKTTLARRIHAELGHFVVSVDKLVAMLAGAYPQLDIRLNWNRRRTTDNIAPFLGHFLGAFEAGDGTVRELNLHAHAVAGNRFVLEGAYFNLDTIEAVLRQYGIDDMRARFALIGLVQNEKTADAFFEDFRRYDTPDDWTYGLGDEDLREVSEEAVAYSRAMTAELERHGFALYDTSVDRAGVFARIVADIRAV